ncbi:MAG: CCA tRNA nucleotidyltransferase [Desulfobacterales bacterium]|nr:CCA tRNA nucleotidyltransferase [Desulfobacterales bacterium]
MSSISMTTFHVEQSVFMNRLKTWIGSALQADDKVYLVGGTVRDLLIGREPKDIDLVCFNARQFAKKIAKIHKAAFICLEKKKDEPCYRVVDKQNPENYIDVVPFRGQTIIEDLSVRDFTINAIAIQIEINNSNDIILEKIIDPVDGQTDLQNRLIRMTYPKCFESDPLRMLRAFRFATTYSLRIDPDTLSIISSQTLLLKQVSFERIYAELLHTLNAISSLNSMTSMNELGLLDLIFNEKADSNVTRYIDDHDIFRFQHIEYLLTHLHEFWPEFYQVIQLNLSSHNRLAMVKLAALLLGKYQELPIPSQSVPLSGSNSIQKQWIEELSMRLKMSCVEREFLLKLLAYQQDVHGLSSFNPNEKDRMRLFRKLKADAVPVILLSMAQSMTQDQSKITWCRQEILHYYMYIENILKRPLLITGNDLISLGMSPGPHIGKMLNEVQEAQDNGEIVNKQDALDLVARLR